MQDKDIIIADNITKSFKVYLDKGRTLKERLVTPGRERYQKREVLKGISFRVKKGEAVGLIGKNGCGKSTTLKMLTKIIYPDSGSIEIKGKVSSLLELGAGFHPDMSGRENIYLNASIFGLTKRDIDRKVDEIIAFSELEEFIENPVRTYSSGMYMRLAFSVAINVDAEVLLIDEILGVGDVSFQKKCFERLQEIKAIGTTIVIVSHSLEQLERICDRCIWISDGKIKEEGIPYLVNAHYYKIMEEERLERSRESKNTQCAVISEEVAEKEFVKKEECFDELDDGLNKYNQTPVAKKELDEKGEISENIDKKVDESPSVFDEGFTRVGNGVGKVTDIFLKNLRDDDNMIFSVGDSMEVRVKIKGKRKLQDTNISISITREDGVYCYGTNTRFDNCKGIDIEEKEKSITFIFDKICLLAGKYYINIGLYDKNFNEYDVIWQAKKFYIKDENPTGEIGIFRMEHRWSL